MNEIKNTMIEISKDIIENKIYIIRNQKIMLDSDLAEIYGYETKNLNRQVKNNIEKFEGEDFMFRLTTQEVKELSRCKNFTLNNIGQGNNIKYNPYAFTEQGIYMLMTVLKGNFAIQQSRALIKAFKQMKDYIIENRDFISSNELFKLAMQTSKNTKDILEIKSNMATKEEFKKVMNNFIDPNTYKHFLLFNGDKIEADIAYVKIYKSAKKSIYIIIDNYIGLKTLELLRAAKNDIEIKIFSDNIKNKEMLTKNILEDFKKSYKNIKINIQIANKKYHDRYIAIDYGTEDEAFYLCGASSKDAGNKISTITKIEAVSNNLYHNMFFEILKNKELNF